MKRILTILFIFFIGIASASGQASRHQLREGNRDYKKQRYEQAEVKYRRALERDSNDYRGQYNLANALYKQKKYDEAAGHYQQALAAPKVTEHQRAQTLHNQGNTLLKSAQQSEQMQGLQQAINCYQEALKLEPKRDDTRYNLAYARRLLQQQQQNQQQNQNQNKDQNQQQNQQRGDNQQDQQQQQQQSQPQGQQDQQNQNHQQRPQPSQLDQRKQDAERMLEAVKNNERQTLHDKNRSDKPVRVKKTDKDW